MAEVSVRPMTATEFENWQHELAADYAREQVAAGNWPAEGAYERAREGNAALLAAGDHLTLTGVAGDQPIGRLWIGLDHPRGVPGCAFLYDIEVAAEHRGRGLGRALLAAGEEAARAGGAQSLELNVFGSNAKAAALYLSSGYEVVTQQLRKPLS
ncbi:hypothetical protein ACTI_74450 [Actinoplanes sp. OR16]|uniref:GNAT family N-acetyltransferase n=1 Tax=Actinoplanes sp. OR16 TaxID=946334 RepID=UPI000F6C19FA|nr:GNAT family N-acetyltransferase [Actinoplanes sp. OR16]BBH70760.1 hypothetical protein ACTI_74450 [Actinoplanes sp. OR16]